jgi:TetR/AcrR family transcriptional repressor of nem operon
MSGRVDQILDVAERMARQGGYGGFSFREIAKEVGIKSASVHYHFPEKEALGVALAKRYADRFLAALGDPEDPSVSPKDLLARIVAAYRSSLADEGLMCLCGMFGAEIADLPPAVRVETRAFFERNADWLETVLTRRGGGAGRAGAYGILATLEGALILGRSLDDVAVFDTAVAGIAD